MVVTVRGQRRLKGLGVIPVAPAWGWRPPVRIVQVGVQTPAPAPTSTGSTVPTSPVAPVSRISLPIFRLLPPAGGPGVPAWWFNQSSNLPSRSNLTVLAQMYATNPASLTADQWAQLQAAGLIPQTLPYSQASVVQAGATTAAPAPDPSTLATGSTDIGSTLSQNYGGLALWQWLAIGGAAYLIFGRKGR